MHNAGVVVVAVVVVVSEWVIVPFDSFVHLSGERSVAGVLVAVLCTLFSLPSKAGQQRVCSNSRLMMIAITAGRATVHTHTHTEGDCTSRTHHKSWRRRQGLRAAEAEAATAASTIANDLHTNKSPQSVRINNQKSEKEEKSSSLPVFACCFVWLPSPPLPFSVNLKAGR